MCKENCITNNINLSIKNVDTGKRKECHLPCTCVPAPAPVLVRSHYANETTFLILFLVIKLENLRQLATRLVDCYRIIRAQHNHFLE